MHIVTCLFNPCKYKRIVENYWKFREKLGHPLVTVELSFDGTFEVPDSIRVEGHPGQIMWQKERLLNYSFSLLPKDDLPVAWLDCDIIFDDSSWYDRTLTALQTNNVVYAYDRLKYLGPDGQRLRTCTSYGFCCAKRTLVNAPIVFGGAVAAKRLVADLGLYDTEVVGGGDSAMANAMTGRWNDPRFNKWITARRTHWGEWARKWRLLVARRVGCAFVGATHLYHGSRANRDYHGRHDRLNNFQYDPAKDVRVASNGAWEWASDKPDMHRQVTEYFESRREDE